MIDYRSLSGRTALIGFALALLLAWVCYRPALTGAYQLDDFSNLGGLSQVSDWDSGLDFTLSGRAGPLGRPIALATFAVQAESWTQGAAAFLRVNFLIHLLKLLPRKHNLLQKTSAYCIAPPDRPLGQQRVDHAGWAGLG